MIEIKNLTKSFKNNVVLSNLNFEINENDLIYLKGRNGSGKSTLLKIICDIIASDQGSVIIHDNASIGALIENPGFLESETIMTNFAFLASLKNNYHIEVIKQYCDYFELDYSSKTKLKNYSVGMRQKAGIIQAIMENQNVIIFDEPTRGLDDASVENFIQLMNELHQKGKTILIASHDFLKDINYTRVCELKNGKIIEAS